MGRKKIEAPTPQVGDVFEEHRGGQPSGRKVRIKAAFYQSGGWVETEPYPKDAPGRETEISFQTLRPTANGWHLVERDGKPVQKEQGK